MVGVDKVPVEPLPRLHHVAPRMLTTIQNRRRTARRVLAARGLDEAVTWSFIPGGRGQALRRRQRSAAARQPDRVGTHRHAALAAAGPARRGAPQRRTAASPTCSSSKSGQVFLDDTPAGQRTYAAAIRTGSARHWRERPRPVDVFDAKADLAALLDALGHDIDKVQIVAEPASWSHPGRGGRVQLGPQNVLGWFGEVHPAVLAEFDLAGPVAAFELDLDAIPEPRQKPTRAKPALALSDLMPVSRDFAFVVDRDVTAAAILRAARNADKALIADVGVFDVFEGARVGEGTKSVAIAVTLQPQGQDADRRGDREGRRGGRGGGDARRRAGRCGLHARRVAYRPSRCAFVGEEAAGFGRGTCRCPRLVSALCQRCTASVSAGTSSVEPASSRRFAAP